MSEWKSFKSAPTNGDSIIVFRPDAGIFVAFCGSDEEVGDACWFSTSGDDLTGDLPSHWMPIPAPPS